MIAKYTRLLEEREVNNATGEIWAIQDVPKYWRVKVSDTVISDGYYFAEDGTAYPVDTDNEDI